MQCVYICARVWHACACRLQGQQAALAGALVLIILNFVYIFCAVCSARHVHYRPVSSQPYGGR